MRRHLTITTENSSSSFLEQLKKTSSILPTNSINPKNPGSDIGWQNRSAEHQKKYKQFLQRADKKQVLKNLPNLHDEAFSKIDCLQCGNCCKNYSPRFKTTDIKRISKLLKMKEGAFIEEYLRLDTDGDYVTKTAPCPFLGADNYCSIYEGRPGDCARYPYTNEDVLLKRPQLTQKNSTVCPAVHFVLEKLIAVK
ncbi:MAG: YkgJ family cysteine cluster protein [Segetibacter sp.]|jgi:Fe-S-cluster containining protein|nr:YkgJ family cysteine cluster protein [Segetibacter sp.]